jgi:hypothetical protein
VEDSQAEAGILVGDSLVAAGNRGAAEDSQAVVEDSPAEAGIPVAEDSRVEEGSPRVAGDSQAVAEDSRVEVGTPAAAEDSQAVAEDSRVEADTLVAEEGTPVVAAFRRRSYRTWRKMCCPDPQGSGNWGRRSAAACRTRYRISVRGRYWRRTWGILSIAAFHISITSITICKGKFIPVVAIYHFLDYIQRYKINQ